MRFLVGLSLIKVGLKNWKLESNHFTNHIACEFASSAFCWFFGDVLFFKLHHFSQLHKPKNIFRSWKIHQKTQKKEHTRPHQRPRKQRPHHHHLLDENKLYKLITKAAKGLRPWERWSFASSVDVVFIASNSLYIEHDKFFRSYLQLGVCGSPSFWRNKKRWKHLGISKVEPKTPFWNKDGLCVWELQIASKFIFSEMPVFRMVASRNWKVKGRTF